MGPVTSPVCPLAGRLLKQKQPPGVGRGRGLESLEDNRNIFSLLSRPFLPHTAIAFLSGLAPC